MRNEELDVRRKLKNNFKLYAAYALKIRGKKGELHPFVLNAAQKYIHSRLDLQKKERGYVRALIIKGRQQGCSTYIAGRFFWLTTHAKGKKALVMTHVEDASRNVYQMVRRFYLECPLALRPSTSQMTAREMVFDRLQSGYKIGTAKAANSGRSETLQYFHGSEVAYWDHAEEHMAGVLQAIALEKGTEIILESTSAGAHGFFYQEVQKALRGESLFEIIFVPWYWQDEYQMVLSPSFQLTADEVEIKAQYHLKNEQIYWRRMKVSELGSLSAFRREYPSSLEEAFFQDIEGALYKRVTLEKNRVSQQQLPELKRIVVAIDPAISSHGRGDETGIIVAGLGIDQHGYVLEDLSGHFTPAEWARRAIDAYHRHRADRIIAEINQGGEMIEHTLKSIDPQIAFKTVHASRGKIARTEPIAALDEEGHIHHVGVFTKLEDQMCQYTQQQYFSPDRMDARTWALTELMLSQKPSPRIWNI